MIFSVYSASDSPASSLEGSSPSFNWAATFSTSRGVRMMNCPAPGPVLWRTKMPAISPCNISASQSVSEW